MPYPQSSVFTDRYSTVTDCRQDVLCSVPGRSASYRHRHCLYWFLSSDTDFISAKGSSVWRMHLPVNFLTGRASVLTALLRLIHFSISTAILVWRTLPRTAEKTSIWTKACDPSPVVSWLPLCWLLPMVSLRAPYLTTLKCLGFVVSNGRLVGE